MMNAPSFPLSKICHAGNGVDGARRLEKRDDRRKQMFAITGITGNVGGELALTLLAAKQPVRAVVRDLGKGSAWAKRGCDLARADIGDAAALAAAFQGVEGVFVLVPPNFDPTPGFPEAQAIADSLFSALAARV